MLSMSDVVELMSIKSLSWPVCAFSLRKRAIQKEIRTFSTMTADLLRMLEWLKQAGCTHVALESTGVYWKPIHNLLETELEVLLINAQHIKAIPGRRTDMKDAEWIADLLQHGRLASKLYPSPTPEGTA